MSKTWNWLRGKKDVIKHSTRGLNFKYWKRFVYRQQLDHEYGLRSNPLTGEHPLKTTMKKQHWYYTEKRPWTSEGKIKHTKLKNQQLKHPLLEPVKDIHLFIGDQVEIQVGRDKGRLEFIVEIIPERNWVFVENSHLQYSSNKLFKDLPAIVTSMEQPLLFNEVKLVDPGDFKTTDVEWRYTDTGEKVRVSSRTNRIIPIPKRHMDTWEDFTNVVEYKDAPKDTGNEALQTVTFEPKLCTFEEDILSKYGIKKKKREKQLSYWY